MTMRSSTSQTTRDLRTAGGIAIAAGVVWTALPVTGAGWMEARLLPAIPLLAVGVALVALTRSKTFLLDRQTDEVERLLGEVASRKGMPEFAFAGRNSKPAPWSKLPFFGLFLGAIAVSAIVRGQAGPETSASASGLATGFLVSGMIMVTVGVVTYRRMLAQKRALIDRLHVWLADNPPATPETA
jgi:hypothetical protein